MTATVLRADARHIPLADDSVDLVVTSPPYFGLRSYQDGGQHYDGQIGDEPTPAEFVAALLDVTRECVRVLKPTGSLWVNLGDKYARAGGGGAGSSDGTVGRNGGHKKTPPSAGAWPSSGGAAEQRSTPGRPATTVPAGLREKSLIGVPWRYALRCIDDLGLILRAEIIWAKPNGLPESVTDRVRRSHEQWFHFTIQPRYFSAVDEVREEYAPATASRNLYARPASGPSRAAGANVEDRPAGMDANPLGKLPGSVWTIPTQPLQVPAHLGVDHFAAFPMEWPRRIIRGWSPSGICVECGEGRRPVVDRTAAPRWPSGADEVGQNSPRANGRTRLTLGAVMSVYTMTGESCACPTPDAATRPAVVLDPFGGTGTTALVASALGRRGVSVDYSADYCRLARWRTTDPGQRATAMQVEKPKAELPGQADLFGGEV